MALVRVYRIGREEEQEVRRTRQKLNSAGLPVEEVRVETCFYIQLRFEGIERKPQLEEVVREKLKSILGDSWISNFGLFPKSTLSTIDRNATLLEIGPRLSFSTAWSTNCVGVCHSMGIDEVKRLEKASRFLIRFSKELEEGNKSKFIHSLYDPMTQQVYDEPLETFQENKIPEKWRTVDVIEGGTRALEDVNASMGLAFDQWDLDYYTHLFCEKIGRNPTTVELFDLAQSNSEHSRHWFFKGIYEVNGKRLPHSLMDLVAQTNTPESTNPNNVIKFSDNSSAIEGWTIPAIIPSDPRGQSRFEIQNKSRHIIFTAETHNFPTGVSPFSGATTGTGGRIRDIQAAGRGGHVIAGTAGYCFGNLHIPGYELEWEEKVHYPSNFASPLEVVIEASNGASDYGNKFGEPVICGFSRSFGLTIGDPTTISNERREWIKPIMFSGGIGSLDANMTKKKDPERCQLVVKIGGPVYRIGVGGGAASSVQVQGDNAASRDLGAVQRGDAEMEQKMNRVIRGCLEMDVNPILAIHDQGAGGNANVLKELMEGAGGVVFSKAFSLGDPTLSTLEIWGAEYQESNALLVEPQLYPHLQLLAQRERCPVDKVGIITGDEKVRLFETNFQEIPNGDSENTLPVNLKLDWVLGKMPQKVFKWTKTSVTPMPLVIPSQETPMSALRRVLRLPAVASKRYLTNKVDRSVTGLVAQQQCVGPLQTPIADVAVTALSYFSQQGAATSIGEQPIKILLNPDAGARMTVLEALTNLVPCLISDLKDVKCSANWMWPAKLPGEGFALYRACSAMCNIMKLLGIAIDGGKDSLSMAARVPDPSNPSKSSVVKAPGALVVSAYAPCPDVSKVVTPDLKSPCLLGAGTLLLIKPAVGYYRLGGSALAQVYSQIGSSCPDVNDLQVRKFILAFNALQELIRQNLLLSVHDISDGGLVVCLIEMAIAGLSGISVDLIERPLEEKAPPPILQQLFNEEIGWVIEIDENKVPRVMSILHEVGLKEEISLIGRTTNVGPNSLIEFKHRDKVVISLSVADATQLWEETSYQLEKLQMNPLLAEEEFKSLRTRKYSSYTINFEWDTTYVAEPQLKHPKTPRMAVVREEGSNGDREMVAAFIQAGFIVHDVTMTDLAKMTIDLTQFRGIAFPGGFSYADVLGSGIGWAASIKERERIHSALENWRNMKSTFSLGVCNGCQLLALLGWIGEGSTVPSVRLDPNSSGRFESRWSRVKIKKSNSILLQGMQDSILGVWVAHGEGKFIYKSSDVKMALANKACIAMQYVDDDDIPTECYPFNPNGSEDGISGLSSSCGRHLALMPHPERCVLSWQWPSWPDASRPSWPTAVAPWAKIFQNAFDWCLKN